MRFFNDYLAERPTLPEARKLILDNTVKEMMLHNCRAHSVAFNNSSSPTLYAMARKLITELESFDGSMPCHTVDFILTTLVFHVRKYKSYTYMSWENSPRKFLLFSSLIHTLMLFSDRNPHEGLNNFLDTGNTVFLSNRIDSMGLGIVNYLWLYDFEPEIAAIEESRRHETSCQKPRLPFTETSHFATITKKEYVGMLDGNIRSKRRIVNFTEENMKRLKIADYRPYLKDAGNQLIMEQFDADSLVGFDATVLRVMYTELLELYKMATPRERAAYKKGASIAFHPQRMLRKMTQNTKNYNLFAKLLEYNNLYSIKLVNAKTGQISLTKLLTVESYNNDIFRINAATLMEMIEEIESGERYVSMQKSSEHTFWLPVGGKRGSLPVRIVAEHIVTMLKHAGGINGKRVEMNLWEIIRQYPQLTRIYNSYKLARNRNVWLSRLVEGLYLTLYEYVAPRYINMKIFPDIVNKTTGKAVNIPTCSTFTAHTITIAHKGLASQN